MDNELKNKVFTSVVWSGIQNISGQFISFFIGIILARILGPEEFGLIGMLTIFIAISNVIINSGFNDALIRRKKLEYSELVTVFWFNLGVSTLLFGVLVLGASWIAGFYSEPQLESLIVALAFGNIISSLAIVQRIVLTKKFDFKSLTTATIYSNVVSGVIAVICALLGAGVWSLVIKILVQKIVLTVLLWKKSSWSPSFQFNTSNFKELYSFGANLMVLSFIDTIYRNMYYLIIGKYYAPNLLGQYTRAESINALPVKSITMIVQKVSFPALAEIQDDIKELRNVYRKIIRVTMLSTTVALMLLSSVAPDFTVILMGYEWALSGEYLQILCYSALLYPLDSLNSNMLKIKNRAGLVLRIGVVRKILAVPLVLLVIYTDVIYMLYGLVVHQLISIAIISVYAGKEIDYKIKDQVSDVMLFIVYGAIVNLGIWMFNESIELNRILRFSVNVGLGLSGWLALLILTKNETFFYVTNLVKQKIINRKQWN